MTLFHSRRKDVFRYLRAIQKFSISFGKNYGNERCQITPHAKIIVIRRITYYIVDANDGEQI